MQPKLTAQFFINNRQALRAKLADKLPIIITGNGLMQRTADNTFPFVQDSNFWYLTGLDTPDALLVIGASEEYIIIPGRSASRQAFDGANDPDGVARRSGVNTILSEVDGWQNINKLISETKQASYLKPVSVYELRHGFYANPARRRVADKLRRLQSNLTLHDIRTELALLRCIKQPIEIACIEAAVRTTKETLAEITNSADFTAMRYEYELEAAITSGFRKRGATGHAYNPIVASGSNATTLHYDHNDAPINSTDYIVVDVGAEVEHYAADITRTLIQGNPSARQQAVFDAVTRLQEQAMAMVKQGVLMQEYEQRFEHVMMIELTELGLISHANDRKGMRRYYPHATSHFLGLDVHDVGDYSQPLAEGMVLTCEPGIYIPEEGIGVRIEDDIVITNNGIRLL